MDRVVWSERALSDLEELLAYLEKESPALARRYGRAILDRVTQLEAHPLSGGVLPEDPTKVYRQLIQGSYRIIYRQEPGRVLIVATHHAARQLDVDTLR